MAVTTVARGTSENKSMTPEIFFARKLASNEKKTRDKFLKKLKKWISARSHTPDGTWTDIKILKNGLKNVYLSFLNLLCSVQWWRIPQIVEGFILLHVDVGQTADSRRPGRDYR